MFLAFSQNAWIDKNKPILKSRWFEAECDVRFTNDWKHSDAK